MNRRTFVLTGVAAGTGLALQPAWSQSTPTTADRIWTGGPILTMNDKAMRAEAIAEAGMNISPTGWVRKRGMIFTSHHDAPVAFPNSMRVLDATVTRRARGSGRIVGPQHRVDVITALKAMTIWPAYQLFEEMTKGSLEVGKLADFVILSKDPTAVAPATIADIQVAETIKEGATVFRLTPTGGKAANGGTRDSFARMHDERHTRRPALLTSHTRAQMLGYDNGTSD